MKGGKVEVSLKRRKARTNWQQSILWKHIDAVRKRIGYRPRTIVRELQVSDSAGLFGGLHAGTVSKWITVDEDGNHTWTPEVLRRAADGAAPAKAGPESLWAIFISRFSLLSLNILIF